MCAVRRPVPRHEPNERGIFSSLDRRFDGVVRLGWRSFSGYGQTVPAPVGTGFRNGLCGWRTAGCCGLRFMATGIERVAAGAGRWV